MPKAVDPMTKKNGTAAKSKAKDNRITSDEEVSIRLDALFEEAEKFCTAFGLHQDLMLKDVPSLRKQVEGDGGI